MSWYDPGPTEISLAIICGAGAALIGAYKLLVWLFL